MKNNKKGEIITILTIGALIVMGITTLASSYFIKQRSSFQQKSKAEECTRTDFDTGETYTTDCGSDSATTDSTTNIVQEAPTNDDNVNDSSSSLYDQPGFLPEDKPTIANPPSETSLPVNPPKDNNPAVSDYEKAYIAWESECNNNYGNCPNPEPTSSNAQSESNYCACLNGCYDGTGACLPAPTLAPEPTPFVVITLAPTEEVRSGNAGSEGASGGGVSGSLDPCSEITDSKERLVCRKEEQLNPTEAPTRASTEPPVLPTEPVVENGAGGSSSSISVVPTTSSTLKIDISPIPSPVIVASTIAGGTTVTQDLTDTQKNQIAVFDDFCKKNPDQCSIIKENQQNEAKIMIGGSVVAAGAILTAPIWVPAAAAAAPVVGSAMNTATTFAYSYGSATVTSAIANSPALIQAAIPYAATALEAGGMALTAVECSNGNQDACMNGFVGGLTVLDAQRASSAVATNVNKLFDPKTDTLMDQIYDPFLSGENIPRKLPTTWTIAGQGGFGTAIIDPSRPDQIIKESTDVKNAVEQYAILDNLNGRYGYPMVYDFNQFEKTVSGKSCTVCQTTMERISGTTLEKALASGYKPKPKAASTFIEHLAKQYVDTGTGHGDLLYQGGYLKTDNIIVTPTGDWRPIDPWPSGFKKSAAYIPLGIRNPIDELNYVTNKINAMVPGLKSAGGVSAASINTRLLQNIQSVGVVTNILPK
ncbi:MAG: hypothetical protein Q7R33_04130 [Nitrosarchaeum sp.]|nr:hypothetical protein [Nitrosarchaeum sp.]